MVAATPSSVASARIDVSVLEVVPRLAGRVGTAAEIVAS
jgi:hypothetical protein